MNPWKVATAVLALIVIVLGFMLWQRVRSDDLGTTLEQGESQIADVRAEVAEACQGPASDDARCERALDELAEVLVEFSADVAETDRGGAVSPDTTP